MHLWLLLQYTGSYYTINTILTEIYFTLKDVVSLFLFKTAEIIWYK